MHKDIIIPNRVCSLGLGLSLGLGGKQTSAAGGGGGGGGGFTPFTDDFTNLDAWSTTGNIALASGRLRVSNGFSSGTGSGYVTGYEMTEAEGSYDLTALMYYSEEFNHQIGFLMDDTLAAKPSFINSTLTGNGYAMWFSSGAVTLHSVVGSQSILKTWFPLIGSGDRLGVRIVFNGDGDMSVTPLHNGSVVSGGSHDIAAASLLANRGSRLGLCGFAAASYTTEFDDVSYDVTPSIDGGAS